jgi:hypothetical protein
MSQVKPSDADDEQVVQVKPSGSKVDLGGVGEGNAIGDMFDVNGTPCPMMAFGL